MTCNNLYCCTASQPEPVDVTINQNIVKIEEGVLHSTTETLTLINKTFILSHAPFNVGGMVVTVGGSLQVYGTDYTVSAAGVITFADSAVVGQLAIAIYEYVTGATSAGFAVTGDMETLAIDNPTEADVKAGYRILDGGALQGAGPGLGYVKALYPDLWQFLAGSLDSATCNPDNFADTVLLSMESQDGVAVSFYRIIKT